METSVLDVVEAVPAIDLSPVEISRSLLSDGTWLMLGKSLILEPTLSGDGLGILEVVVEDRGINAYGETREELLEAIADDIDAVWFHYANPRMPLTPEAEKIGRWWRENAHIARKGHA